MRFAELDQFDKGCLVLVCCQQVCQVVVAIHFGKDDDVVVDEVPHVEVACMDVPVATILNWVFRHANGG